MKNECTSCEYLKEELEQLKEDYERYKLRAQSVLKNKHKVRRWLSLTLQYNTVCFNIFINSQTSFWNR